jgi:hypothetical protein
LVTGLWEAVPTLGSHPGLSDEQEERFRLITVTDCSRFLLARLDTLRRDQRSRRATVHPIPAALTESRDQRRGWIAQRSAVDP